MSLELCSNSGVSRVVSVKFVISVMTVEWFSRVVDYVNRVSFNCLYSGVSCHESDVSRMV